MSDGFGWLIAVIGVISLFKGIESVFPKMARSALQKRMQQPDYYFRAVGALFICAGLAVIYVGLR